MASLPASGEVIKTFLWICIVCVRARKGSHVGHLLCLSISHKYSLSKIES